MSDSQLVRQTPDSLTMRQSLWLNVLTINLQSGLLVVDENLQVIFLNPQFCNFFQVHKNPVSFIDKNIMDLLGEIDKTVCNVPELSYQLNDQADKKQINKKLEIKLGEADILQATYVPLSSENNLSGHAWIFNNETENKEALTKAQKEKTFLENILNALPESVSALNADGEYLFANTTEQPDDHLKKWMIGKKTESYFDRINKDKASAELLQNKFNKTISESSEASWQEKSEDKDFQKKFIPLFDEKGALVSVINTSVDISAQKDLEKKLELSDKRINDFFNNTKAIICTHDMDGIIISANPALCDMLGCNEDELKGKSIQEYFSLSEKDVFNTVYLKELRDNKKSEGLFKIKNKNDQTVYLLYQNYVVDETSEKPYVIGFAQDISRRIYAEKKLRVARKVAQQLADSKEKFLRSMSHAIRTPMNGIIGIASLLQKTILSGEQKFYLDIIEESAQKLLDNINRIQETSIAQKKAEGILIVDEEEPDEIKENPIISVPGLNEYSSQKQPEMKEEPATVTEQTLPDPKKELGKLKILLAEDNDINQVLAKNILRHWGFESHTVTDGEQVLDALQKENFDLILMDIQMPLKNGMEVSQEIRELTDDVKRNIPIIALTAFTIKGEEKKYTSAGMDACLTKPFKEKELFEAISKVFEARKKEPNFYKLPVSQEEHKPLETKEEEVGHEEKTQENIQPEHVSVDESFETSASEPTPEFSYTEKLYDLTYLRGIQGSSTDLVNKLIEIFIRTVPPATKEMVNASDNQEWDAVTKLAHKVKSSINTMGIHSLKGDIKFIEEAASQRVDLPKVSAAISKLNSAVKVASEQLQEELNMQFALLN